jgi:hypothetical protein
VLHWSKRRGLTRRLQCCKNSIAWPIGLNLTIAQHQNTIRHRHSTWTMGDQKHGRTFGFEQLDGFE